MIEKAKVRTASFVAQSNCGARDTQGSRYRQNSSHNNKHICNKAARATEGSMTSNIQHYKIPQFHRKEGTVP